MKVVAFSDVHDNQSSFMKFLSHLSAVEFDLIICAGDLGHFDFSLVAIEELTVFDAPFLYVQGNWDGYDFDEKLGPNAFHIHLRPFNYGGYTFVGYSGCASDYYGENPSLKEFKNGLHGYDECKAIGPYARQIREMELGGVFSGLDQRRTVLVSHEHIGHLKVRPLVHIYGHRHMKEMKFWRDILYLNVSALDESANQKGAGGRYCILELDGDAQSVTFHRI